MAVVTHIFNVPSNTLANAKIETEVSLQAGRLVSIGVGFLDGCMNMVHVTIHHRLKQILPSVEGQSLSWNNHVFFFPYDIKIQDVGTKLKLSGWSPNTRYEHDIYFWFVMVDESKAKSESLIDRFLFRTPG